MIFNYMCYIYLTRIFPPQITYLYPEAGGDGMSKGRLLHGTVVLTAAGILVKLMGAAYRIPLSRLLGEEGIGLYQMAYPIYLVFLSVSTAGLPIAISKLVAEGVAKGDYYGVKRLFRLSLISLGAFGLLGSMLMGCGASWFSRHMAADPRSMLAMLALAPAVTLMAVVSAFRGYFQGWQEMRPSGLSQLWEQAVRVVVLLTLAVLLLPRGIEWAAAGAAFGATAGAGAGVFYLSFHYIRVQKRLRELERKKHIQSTNSLSGFWLKRLLQTALPIALGSVLMPLMQAVDSIIVPGKLQAGGYTVSQATAALGQLGNAWAVLYLPLIVTSALSTGLVPAIADALARGDRSELAARIEEGYRVASWVLPGAATGLLVMGEEIYRLIYGGYSTSILVTLAPGVFLLGWQQVSAAILQGAGQPFLPLRHFVVGCFVKSTLTLLLVGRPNLGIHGAAIATVTGSMAATVLNMLYVCRLNLRKSWLRSIWTPLIASIIMGSLGRFLRIVCLCSWSSPLLIAVMLLIQGIVYIVAIWLMGGISSTDLEHFRQRAASNV
jgi:stage V sporulation protein B